MASDDRPLLPWRFVVGVMLHIAVPAYLVALAAALVPTGSTGWHPAAAALRVSLWFVPAYALATAVAGGIAVPLDRWLRRRRDRGAARDPAAAAIASRRRVEHALASAATMAAGQPRLLAALAALRTDAWPHGNRRGQSLSDHFADAVATFAAASARANLARRAELVDLAAASFDHIAAELARLDAEHGDAADARAEDMARFLKLRFGASDFAGDAPD